MSKLALVGYGNIARRHLEVFRELGCGFTGVCNRSEAGRRRAREEGGIPRSYDSISEMIERERPAGVLCCVSYDSMFDAASEILPFGVPTLLEKPPGLSTSQARGLADLAREFRTPLVVGVNRRHYSVLRKALADAGGPKSVTAVMVDWSERPDFFLDRGDSHAAVERLVFANTLHALDTMTFLGGAVPNPAITCLSRGEPLKWEMALQGISKKGVLVSLTSTWDSPCRWRISFCVPGKRYEFAPLETCRVYDKASSGVREIEPSADDTKFKPGFLRQAREFLRLITTGATREDLSIESVLPAMELAEKLTTACLESKGHKEMPGKARRSVSTTPGKTVERRSEGS